MHVVAVYGEVIVGASPFWGPEMATRQNQECDFTIRTVAVCIDIDTINNVPCWPCDTAFRAAVVRLL